MHDKDLIEKICNLTCDKNDVYRNQTTINYDYEYPFKKYYDVNIIIGAFNKYLSKEWDDRTLAGWFCIYNWIICGGFHDDLKENLNSLEEFLKDVISWYLDGLSFFDEENYLEDGMNDVYSWIDGFKNLDHIWQTRNDWKAVYAMVGKFAAFNENQYVVLINEKLNEYIIIHSDHLENGFEDEIFKYTTEEEFAKLIEKLKENYKIISCSEEFYYSDLYDVDD